MREQNPTSTDKTTLIETPSILGEEGQTPQALPKWMSCIVPSALTDRWAATFPCRTQQISTTGVHGKQIPKCTRVTPPTGTLTRLAIWLTPGHSSYLWTRCWMNPRHTISHTILTLPAITGKETLIIVIYAFRYCSKGTQILGWLMSPPQSVLLMGRKKKKEELWC